MVYSLDNSQLIDEEIVLIIESEKKKELQETKIS